MNNNRGGRKMRREKWRRRWSGSSPLQSPSPRTQRGDSGTDCWAWYYLETRKPLPEPENEGTSKGKGNSKQSKKQSLAERTSILPSSASSTHVLPSIKSPSPLSPILTTAQERAKQRSRNFSLFGQFILGSAFFVIGFQAWKFYFQEGAKLQNHSYHPFVVEKVERDEDAGTVRIGVRMPWGAMGERMWFEREYDLIPEEQERIVSLFVKQPQLQIERPYTPLFYPFRPLEETTVETLKTFGVKKAQLTTEGKNDTVLELLVKRYEDGEVSRWLWNLNPGDKIELKGMFELWGRRWKDAHLDFEDYFFIVGGTGITTFHQFASHIFSRSPDPYNSQQNRFVYFPSPTSSSSREEPVPPNPPPYPGQEIPPKPRLHLLYGARSPKQIFLKKEIDELRERYPGHVKVWYFVDEDDPSTPTPSVLTTSSSSLSLSPSYATLQAQTASCAPGVGGGYSPMAGRRRGLLDGLEDEGSTKRER
ncbi:hypothetical protein BT69DRAFT_139816 [Atractiella rhizophila]|nr:hypothetical protein BT69DRAFT_139816 [Atractiella rhizophila]